MWQTLHLVANEPLFRLSDLDGASAELGKRALALKWLGKERIPEILRFADEARGIGEKLAAGVALVHLGVDSRNKRFKGSIPGMPSARKS